MAEVRISVPFLLGILAALFVHGYLARLPVRLSPTLTFPPKTALGENDIEVERWPEDQRAVVSTSRAISPDEAPEAKARFLGEFRQRVKKETQSALKGRMREGLSRQSPTEIGTGIGNFLVHRSTNPHGLPEDIAAGDQTVLNTDPVLYASFINRISDEIYDTWVENVRGAVGRLYQDKRSLDGEIYITRVEVVLDSSGGVLSIKTLQSSGVNLLDEAPKKAFWENEPFPNPPSQLLGEEGLARFIYEFRFEWSGSGFRIIPRLL